MSSVQAATPVPVPSSSSKGLTGGAIAGIAIGAGAGVALILGTVTEPQQDSQIPQLIHPLDSSPVYVYASHYGFCLLRYCCSEKAFSDSMQDSVHRMMFCQAVPAWEACILSCGEVLKAVVLA